jgi:phospholipid/cholesterol/gamma-HCH transport system permease protein
MTTSTTAPRLPLWLEPVGWLGQTVIAGVSYAGGIAMLMAAAAGSLVRFWDEEDQPGFWPLMKAELWWFLLMGFPLVGLVHVGMGSFLSLQAYFGSTFVDGTGAVVGVGLLRNLATLMAGLTLSGLFASRIISELVGPGPIDREPRALDSKRGVNQETRRPGAGPASRPDRGKVAAPRLAAAAVATTLLSLWGALVGTAVGWQCADKMMGLSSETFFMMFYQMIWFRDIIGVVFKGALFGLFPAAICCFEGLRLAERSRESIEAQGAAGPRSHAEAFGGHIVRATSLSMASILLVNMTWFLLVYHAVPVFGPSLLNPPGP